MTRLLFGFIGICSQRDADQNATRVQEGGESITVDVATTRFPYFWLGHFF